jgi:hypothetical protein
MQLGENTFHMIFALVGHEFQTSLKHHCQSIFYGQNSVICIRIFVVIHNLSAQFPTKEHFSRRDMHESQKNHCCNPDHVSDTISTQAQTKSKSDQLEVEDMDDFHPIPTPPIHHH